MSDTHKGYLIFLAAVGMLATLIGVEISDLGTWGDVVTPKFVGAFVGHVGAVVGAFVGGRLIPTRGEQ